MVGRGAMTMAMATEYPEPAQSIYPGQNRQPLFVKGLGIFFSPLFVNTGKINFTEPIPQPSGKMPNRDMGLKIDQSGPSIGPDNKIATITGIKMNHLTAMYLIDNIFRRPKESGC